MSTPREIVEPMPGICHWNMSVAGFSISPIWCVTQLLWISQANPCSYRLHKVIKPAIYRESELCFILNLELPRSLSKIISFKFEFILVGIRVDCLSMNPCKYVNLNIFVFCQEVLLISRCYGIVTLSVFRWISDECLSFEFLLGLVFFHRITTSISRLTVRFRPFCRWLHRHPQKVSRSSLT